MLTNLGRVELLNKNVIKAINLMEKAVENDPDFAKVWANLAYTLYTMGRFDNAKEAIYKSIKLDPENDKSYSLLSSILLKLQKLGEAEKNILISLRLNPNSAYNYSILAIIYQKIKTTLKHRVRFVER